MLLIRRVQVAGGRVDLGQSVQVQRSFEVNHYVSVSALNVMQILEATAEI